MRFCSTQIKVRFTILAYKYDVRVTYHCQCVDSVIPSLQLHTLSNKNKHQVC